MRNIIQRGQHVLVGGPASNLQFPVVREWGFTALYGVPEFGELIFVTEDASDGERFNTAFAIWRAARGKLPRPVRFANIGDCRTAEDILHRVDAKWNFCPVIFIRDLSGNITNPHDRWFEWVAKELQSTYACAIFSVVNSGPHKAVAARLTEYPASEHYEADAEGRGVLLRNVRTGERLAFDIRNVAGGMVLDQKELAL